MVCTVSRQLASKHTDGQKSACPICTEFAFKQASHTQRSARNCASLHAVGILASGTESLCRVSTMLCVGADSRDALARGSNTAEALSLLWTVLLQSGPMHVRPAQCTSRARTEPCTVGNSIDGCRISPASMTIHAIKKTKITLSNVEPEA